MKEPMYDAQARELPTLSSTFLNGVRTMDAASWSRLVLTFGPIVYRWCRRSGLSETDSSDVMQDVFATIARSISNFEKRREQGSFRSWLASITRSRVQDFLRRELRHVAGVGGTDAQLRLQCIEEELDSSIHSDIITGALLRQSLETISAEFEEVTWQAFWLTTVESLKPSIAAERLSVSLASVYQARSRVLRRLRTKMRELP